MNILEIFINSIILIFSLDRELWDIITLSLFVSFTALILASILGFLIGYYFALYDFFLKKLFLIFINSLMGIPPVVVGLIVYFIFAAGGPLGVMQLLYTPSAMIIAQTIIIFPIVASLSHEIFSKNWFEFKDQIRSLNIPFFATKNFSSFGSNPAKIAGAPSHLTVTSTGAFALPESISLSARNARIAWRAPLTPPSRTKSSICVI